MRICINIINELIIKKHVAILQEKTVLLSSI